VFRLIGEDYSFCDKYVAKYGKPISVWSNFDFVHHGFKGNFWDYLNAQKDAQELAQSADINTREDCNTSSAA
jgi:hypothetical protein